MLGFTDCLAIDRHMLHVGGGHMNDRRGVGGDANVHRDRIAIAFPVATNRTVHRIVTAFDITQLLEARRFDDSILEDD